MISFTIGKERRMQLHAILTDAIDRKVIAKSERLDIEMSVCAYIAQGGELNLDKLQGFDDFDLRHDLFGIDRNIDKDDDSPTAGKLLNFFVPRAA